MTPLEFRFAVAELMRGAGLDVVEIVDMATNTTKDDRPVGLRWAVAVYAEMFAGAPREILVAWRVLPSTGVQIYKAMTVDLQMDPRALADGVRLIVAAIQTTPCPCGSARAFQACCG